MLLGKEKLKKGGWATHLTPNVRALWLYLYNNGRDSAYRLFKGLLAGPQKKAISKLHHAEFAAQGHPREFAVRMAKYYRDVGYPPEDGVWIVNWDAAKMQERLQWDPKTNKFVGSVDFNSDLSFDSYQDWVDFRSSKVAAGYILPIVVCPSDAALPQAVRVAALIPTDLTYTANDLHEYLTAVSANLRGEGFRFIIVNGADHAAVHGTEMVRRALPEHYAEERQPGRVLGDEIAAISTLRGYHERGAECPTVQILDPAHGAKNGSLLPLSMARLLLLGVWPVLCTMLVTLQRSVPAAGLHTADVNGSDRMDVSAALRRLNFSVRHGLRQQAGTFGAIVYYYFMACTISAFFDHGNRDKKTTPRERARRVLLNLVFLRYWHGWIVATGSPAHHFISIQTFRAYLLKDMGLLLLILMFGSTPELRRKPFTPWLWGSNQIEHMLSEWRAFEQGNATWRLLSVINICRRWLYQTALFASADVELPAPDSNRGYNRTRFSGETSEEYVQSDYPTAEELISMYKEVVKFVQQVLAALGMAQALYDAGMWDEPPLETWEHVQAAAESPAERAAAAADAAQFEGQALQEEVGAEAAEAAQAAGAAEEAQEEAAAAAAAAEAAAAEAALRRRQRVQPSWWAPGGRYVVAEIMAHANKGTVIGLAEGRVKILERYLQVRWAGEQWRASSFWTWEPQSALIPDIPELIGEYCRRKTLVVPIEVRERVEAAMAEAEAAAAEEEVGGAASTAPHGRPESQTPIPEFDVEALLDIFVAPIGDEDANVSTRRVSLPEAATGAQRHAFEGMRVLNPSTNEDEHKQTLIEREQYQHSDDKAAAGRLRYRHSSRMAIISEDRLAGTGFWQAYVYQFHRSEGAGRELKTKAGPLPLEGLFAVGYARILEIRRAVGQGSVAHPRLSVRREDAERAEAVLRPLVEDAEGLLYDDLKQPPLLVPLSLLGCRMAVEELSPDAGASPCFSAHRCRLLRPEPSVGGTQLRPLVLDDHMFAASAMIGGGEMALEDMKLVQLREELAARDARRTGAKAALQRRLHALLVRAAILQQDETEGEAGEEGDGESEGDGEEVGESEGEEGELEHAGARGMKRWRPGMSDSSDEEGARLPGYR